MSKKRKKFLIFNYQFFNFSKNITNHTASGHQSESCTLKGFAPYIHIYKNIYTYIFSKTQVQVGHTSKVSSTAWFEEIMKIIRKPL